ncbi:hypothetical protein ANANG_G00274290 [Anguilla anguilla]|uniref:Uncharacterized protein n=1 Tax=Anguilla anguilla TaxID=7936 RepID=A0A9D3LME1_ANGAN|nr:hypothetical protein ANANG_G00274290 [Anguilla anguilla]
MGRRGRRGLTGWSLGRPLDPQEMWALLDSKAPGAPEGRLVTRDTTECQACLVSSDPKVIGVLQACRGR